MVWKNADELNPREYTSEDFFAPLFEHYLAKAEKVNALYGAPPEYEPLGDEDRSNFGSYGSLKVSISFFLSFSFFLFLSISFLILFLVSFIF